MSKPRHEDLPRSRVCETARLDTTNRVRRRVLQATHPVAPSFFGRPLRRRIALLAPDYVEAIRCAGGWLFDLVATGWDVAVFTADHVDPRPLQILGAHTYNLDAVLANPLPDQCLQGLAVQAGLHASDPRARRMVCRTADEGLAEVRLWGDDSAEYPDGPVRHQLSRAAVAFKTHALIAAASADLTGDTEVFQRWEAKPPDWR